MGLAATWEAQAQGATSQAAGDAELALIALGFKQVESRKAIAAHLKDHPDADADELIRAALDAPAPAEPVALRLLTGTRADGDGYDARDYGSVRIYNAEGLIRAYACSPESPMPCDE